MLDADFIAGAAACVAVWWRRRWPLGLALALAPLTAFSAMAAGASAVALFGLAVRRPLPAVARVTVLYIAAAIAYVYVRPDVEVSAGWAIAFGVAITIGVVGWGMYVRARLELISSLEDRAMRSETEQQERIERARRAERMRVAREMHDVLGHRLSLLSLHAGAMEFAGIEATPSGLQASPTVIRENAHQALEDLRAVVGLLRDEPESGSSDPEAPQPTLADLPRLLEESRNGGMDLIAELTPDIEAVPEATGRQAYRIVQEGLTNARKHAAGCAVELRLSGGPGSGLEVELLNELPPNSPAGPGYATGSGLLGVAERAHLTGGRSEHGVEAAGRFRLWTWLPWDR